MSLFSKSINKMAKMVMAMSTFGRYDGICFFIYSSDVNERPHVHARWKGYTAKIWLVPEVKFAKQGRASDDENSKCLKTVKKYKTELLDKFLAEKRRSMLKKASCKKIEIPYLPIFGKLLSVLPKDRIKHVHAEIDEIAGCVEFEEFGGISPWLEICYFKDLGLQHVRLEIETPGSKMYVFETFVSPGEEDKITRKIASDIEAAYTGATL